MGLEDSTNRFSVSEEGSFLPEERLMLGELRPDFHGTAEEIDFVREVAGKIRAQRYTGPIEIIGSRTRGSLLSEVNWPTERLLNSASYWFEIVNTLVRERALNPNQLPRLKPVLEEMAAPRKVIELMDDIDTSSDFDILVVERPPGIQMIYADKQTGVTIDVCDHSQMRDYFADFGG